MNITGIIAEYDPLHNGHAHHIATARALGADRVIVVLGGNFTQRGEPALLPKSERVRMALANGADLIVELPQPWACACAENFAKGGVSILHDIGCVNTVCFGSECGNTALLMRLAALMQTTQFSEKLQLSLQNGAPYAAAVQQAVEQLTDPQTAAVLREPNNTLGLEYCKALLHYNSTVRPLAVMREGGAHNSHAAKNGITSAGHIRTLVKNGEMKKAANYMPPSAYAILETACANGHALTDTDTAHRIMLAYLRRLSKADFAALPSVGEGLENRLYAAVQQYGTLSEVTEAISTKRYTAARIRRILTAGYIGLPTDWEQQKPPYVRVLGLGARGGELLSKIQKNAAIPLFTDPMHPPADHFSRAVFQLECRASDLYGALLPTPTPSGQIFTVGMLKHPAKT